MNDLILNMPRGFWRLWLGCMCVPLPVLVLWQSHDGHFAALCLFFAASSLVVVRAFSGKSLEQMVFAARQGAFKSLRRKRLSVVLALLVSWFVFALSSLTLNDAHDGIAPALALAALIPSWCIAPYYALRLRKPVASVVFTVFSLGSMKLVAGSVTCFVYGWHADQAGKTVLTWTHPNVIVYAFLASSAIVSSIFFVMANKEFDSICNSGEFESDGVSGPALD